MGPLQGSAQGFNATVVYHHGWPSSGAEAKAWHTAANAQHMQIIAVDRPGIAESTFYPQGK